jgi:hypothetical protein
MRKKGYEFSFAWIFTIFVGAAVIFLAIYIAVQIVGTKQIEREATEGKSLGTLLTPIETSIEQGKFAKIILSDKITLENECIPPATTNPFGSQHISLSIASALSGATGDSGFSKITFHNKYLFSSNSTSADENIYVLSKPLYLPFKVADLMILWGDNETFCFYDINHAPIEVRTELQDLNLTNVILQNSGESKCDKNKHEVVCFGSGVPCEIFINTNQDTVTKNGATLYYAKSFQNDPYSLLYAAIFSDPSVYECQVKRLMSHTSKLLEVYSAKSRQMQSQTGSGCTQSLQADLSYYNSTADSIAFLTGNSKELKDKNIGGISDAIGQSNQRASCSLF